VKAVWQGTTIAESDDTVVAEGNHYFPRSALRDPNFAPSSHTSVCGWKGTAHYLDCRRVGDKGAVRYRKESTSEDESS
jgi:uncharacterized protein (DUF427 family)